MPTVQPGESLARKFRDIAWRTHQRDRVASALAPHRQPLDLNALFPFPRHVLRKGFTAAGQEWMWRNWESAGRSRGWNSRCSSGARDGRA